jgi:hypothetical protein
MTRREYFIQILGAHVAMRRAALMAGLPVAILSTGATVWMYLLVKSDPNKFPQFAAFALPICLVVMVALFLYVGKTFARTSPVCPSCSRHVRILQRRRVWASGQCVYCCGQIVEP